ncbi:MAG: hypothetical protein GF418_12635 [Chitinivibrionales bacterium]|nr:hypothetical protein [Chitinivibrionales bacterium]MBD3396466.1 hypothetical protein [Chitinivibrionales bacterium]
MANERSSGNGNSEEKRSLKRVEPYYYLRVYDGDTKSYVGSVVDISKKGMKLLSERPFEIDSTYRLRLPLPEDSIFGDTLKVEAKACWCTPLKGTTGYESGFEFEQPVNDGVFAIESIIRDLRKEKLI